MMRFLHESSSASSKPDSCTFGSRTACRLKRDWSTPVKVQWWSCFDSFLEEALSNDDDCLQSFAITDGKRCASSKHGSCLRSDPTSETLSRGNECHGLCSEYYSNLIECIYCSSLVSIPTKEPRYRLSWGTAKGAKLESTKKLGNRGGIRRGRSGRAETVGMTWFGTA